MRGVAPALLFLAGCGTVADLGNQDHSDVYLGRRGPNIMGGVRLDVARMSDSGCKGIALPFYVIDVPFSLALDAALLPLTIPYVLLSDGRGDSEPLPER